ncbi:MAG: pyrroline-5-carboxylate reductase [Clostridiales bacterium]|nr:pyrroline-5-carboxylate reductase [Clostridiales bacterium]
MKTGQAPPLRRPSFPGPVGRVCGRFGRAAARLKGGIFVQQTIGLIGMGNIAYAIASGGLAAGALQREQLIGFDPLPKNLDLLGIEKAQSELDLVRRCDLVVLAVKPHLVEQVLKKVGEALAGKALISVALGWRFQELSAVLPKEVRIQAVMPNTPMQVGEGVCVFEERNTLDPQELEAVKALFSAIGIVSVLPTALMKSAGSVTGCGPAFTYVYLEALADAAVYHGVPRADAYRLAAQTVLGAARMVLESGLHPGQLKDNVCSPGGSTIRGIAKLEEKGFRSAVIEAIREIEQFK